MQATLPRGATRKRPARPAAGSFVRAVARVVRRIPRGSTLSYGAVALRAGKPGAARAVVSALRGLDQVPWWRVARHDGTLAPAVAREQAALLLQEGWTPPPGRASPGRRGLQRGRVARPRRRAAPLD